MKLMARFLLNNICNGKGFMPTATEYQGFLPKDRGGVVEQYMNKVLTFIVIPARIE